MSTLQSPRPRVNSAPEVRSKRTQSQQPNLVYSLPSSSSDKHLPRTIPKSPFGCELQAPAPLRTRSGHHPIQGGHPRKILKQRPSTKFEPSPLASSSMIWEEIQMVEVIPHQDSFPYPFPSRSSRSGQLSTSSPTLSTLRSPDVQFERKKTFQICDDDDEGFYCFGRCFWFTGMLSLKSLPVPPGTDGWRFCLFFLIDLFPKLFTSLPGRGTPNNLLEENRFSSYYLPRALS
jgi:hypothetical protein